MKSLALTPIALAGALLAAGDAAAEPEWISFDGTPPGTEATVVVDPDSNHEKTIVHVRIPGLWVEDRLGGDGEFYQQVSAPGLGYLNTPGVPELPTARIRIARASSEPRVTLGQVTERDVHELFVRPWPHPIPEMDGGEDGGQPEQWVINEEIYFSDETYPATAATPFASFFPMMGSIEGAECGINPCVYDARAGAVRVVADGTWTFNHAGTALSPERITRDRHHAAGRFFTNFSEVSEILQWDPVFYSADYLIVHPEGYLDALQPFIAHLKTRGFRVTTVSTELTGPVCDNIRAEIAAWYAASPGWFDQYCLLVGDVFEIPLCPSPPTSQNGLIVNTDDLYGSVGGDDLNEEVYVGRLSVNDVADMTTQLQKIMDYTNGSVDGWNRNAVALVAHKEGSPGKYEGSHENVRTYSYSNPPQFQTYYGANGATDADVSDAIDAGLGVVAYRGHGNTNAWTTWNLMNNSWGTDDVNGLSNGAMTPVVWSFSCTNSNLNASDCLAERWLARVDGGAVSHYGATRTSYTGPNHKLNESMFAVAFDWQMPTQAHVIASAEALMSFFTYDDNAWMYLLNGDPSMPIRDDDESFTAFVPEYIELCEIPCDWPFTVLDELGNPVPDILVSVWKAGPGVAGAADEVFTNTYTDAAGEAVLTFQPETTGDLHYFVRDTEGHTVSGMIPVVDDPVDVPGAVDAAVRFRALPAVMATRTAFQFGVPMSDDARVLVHDAAGRLVTELDVASGQAAVAWDGRDASGAPVASGVYFARLEGTRRTHTTRVVVLR